MTFFTWMKRNHRHKDSAIGHLADEMCRHSARFIRATGYNRNYFYASRLCTAAYTLPAFDEAWRKYEVYKREQRNV